MQPDRKFQCPVCRARQPLQDQCRRCRADLSLVVAIRNRIRYLQNQLERTANSTPADDNRLSRELKLLTEGQRRL